MRKTSLLWGGMICLCLFLLGVAANLYEDRQIHYVETHITLIEPVRNYDRYYALTADGLRAIYVGHAKGRIHKVFLASLPSISDGGCAVVEVSYSRETKMIKTDCHGEA